MLKSIKVRDYMTRHLVTFRSDTDLFTACLLYTSDAADE